MRRHQGKTPSSSAFRHRCVRLPAREILFGALGKDGTVLRLALLTAPREGVRTIPDNRKSRRFLKRFSMSKENNLTALLIALNKGRKRH
jgi:hypothetical protein